MTLTLTLTSLHLEELARTARAHQEDNAGLWEALAEGLENGLLGFEETVDRSSKEAGAAFMERVRRYELVREGKETV